MEKAVRERKERFHGVVRPAREGDILALREITGFWLRDGSLIAYNEVEEDMEVVRESFREASDKSVFVAESEGGEVIGMMGLSDEPKQELIPFAQTDNPSELIIAFVHPTYRGGHGVGTALITTVQNLAMSKGKKEILLESGPRHISSGYPFYDKQPGFKRAGIIKDFYGKGADTVVWQKTFQSNEPHQ